MALSHLVQSILVASYHDSQSQLTTWILQGFTLQGAARRQRPSSLVERQITSSSPSMAMMQSTIQTSLTLRRCIWSSSLFNELSWLLLLHPFSGLSCRQPSKQAAGSTITIPSTTALLQGCKGALDPVPANKLSPED